MPTTPIESIVPDWPAPAHVRAFTTTRAGGVSQGAFATFNLGANSGDDPAAVAENRRRFQACLPSAPGWIQQVHGTAVVRREALPDSPPEADAVWADSPDRACTLLTADCLPVLFCDREGSRVAAAHAGWRGLAAGVVEATVAALRVAPDRLMAWLGPGISGAVYEVGEDFRAAMLKADPEAAHAMVERDHRLYADLFLMARQRLERAGVGTVHGGEHCTFSDPRFYSYRRDGRTGRMATVIWLARDAA